MVLIPLFGLVIYGTLHLCGATSVCGLPFFSFATTNIWILQPRRLFVAVSISCVFVENSKRVSSSRQVFYDDSHWQDRKTTLDHWKPSESCFSTFPWFSLVFHMYFGWLYRSWPLLIKTNEDVKLRLLHTGPCQWKSTVCVCIPLASTQMTLRSAREKGILMPSTHPQDAWKGTRLNVEQAKVTVLTTNETAARRSGTELPVQPT